jgi:uncharacterized protein (DUF433 family)
MFYDMTVAPAPRVDSGIEISAYTADRARRLTGLTVRQIQYWDELGFIRPSLTRRKGRGRRRLYSFRDLVSLKVAADLRRSVSLQLIRKVNDHLRRLDYRNPLAELSFVIVGGKLYFEESARWQDSRQLGQVVASFIIRVGAIAADLQQQIRIDQARARRPGVIERRRGVLGGKPVLAGTRIAVQTIKNLLRDGASVEEIRELYPDLGSNDIQAADKADLSRRRKLAS